MRVRWSVCLCQKGKGEDFRNEDDPCQNPPEFPQLSGRGVLVGKRDLKGKASQGAGKAVSECREAMLRLWSEKTDGAKRITGFLPGSVLRRKYGPNEEDIDKGETKLFPIGNSSKLGQRVPITTRSPIRLNRNEGQFKSLGDTGRW